MHGPGDPVAVLLHEADGAAPEAERGLEGDEAFDDLVVVALDRGPNPVVSLGCRVIEPGLQVRAEHRGDRVSVPR